MGPSESRHFFSNLVSCTENLNTLKFFFSPLLPVTINKGQHSTFATDRSTQLILFSAFLWFTGRAITVIHFTDPLDNWQRRGKKRNKKQWEQSYRPYKYGSNKGIVFRIRTYKPPYFLCITFIFVYILRNFFSASLTRVSCLPPKPAKQRYSNIIWRSLLKDVTLMIRNSIFSFLDSLTCMHILNA